MKIQINTRKIHNTKNMIVLYDYWNRIVFVFVHELLFNENQ